jgi:biopolymer transport protein TolQ
MHNFSLIHLILQADFIVQLVMLILFFASIFSWKIIFEKFVKFSFLQKRSENFENILESAKMIDDIYIHAKKNNNHLLANIFVAAINEWQASNVKKIIKENDFNAKTSLKERLTNAMQIATSESIQKLEKSLGFLAIIGSTAPFIGLFGTVWGIMNSFQGIAVSKNTSLAVVAPGIAEALLATAIGLFAAIPAVFFYNILTAKINQFLEKAGNFSLQILNLLSSELDK